MKKLFLLAVVVLGINSASAQSLLGAHKFEHKDIETYIASHKTIAIMPFDAQIKMRAKKKVTYTLDQIRDLENKEGTEVQRGMYAWFLKRQKRGSLSVEVQDPRRTRLLLRKAGVDPNDWAETHFPEEIAEILGVDAIFAGDFITSQPMSESGAVVMSLLVGGAFATNKASINILLYDKSGENIFAYRKQINGGLGSGTEDLINVLMRKASRRISYNKR